MNKLKTLQAKINDLFYATYDHGTYFTWQYKKEFIARMGEAGLPAEWVTAKRLAPSEVHKLRELCKKYYPRMQW